MERWMCPHCKRKWIFPVSQCVYCKEDVIVEKSTTLKVVGVTKVYIPSPMHPIVPYNILLLEDEHGNKMPKKTMKEYTIGEMYQEKASEDEHAVSIIKIKYDALEAVEKALELIGNLNVNDSSKVLIKPNIEAPTYPYLSITTNPEVLDALIKYLTARNVKKENITVAENVLYGNFDENVKRTGIAAVCKKHNVRLVDLAKTEFVKREIESRTFEISKELFTHDIIINLPVLKTNVQFSISRAFENMQRVVNIKTNLMMCSTGMTENLVYLNKILPKYITIGDASIGLQGQGPLQLGECAFLNIIVASHDPVALDKVFVEMGILDNPPYLNLAEKLNLGTSKIKDITIVGNDIKAVQFELKKAEQPIKVHPNINIYDGKACTMCFHAAMELSKLTGISGYDINLFIGKEFTKEIAMDKERIVAFGDNAIEKLAEFGIKPIAELKGHPPDATESMMLIKKLIEKEDATINLVDTLASKIASKAKGFFS